VQNLRKELESLEKTLTNLLAQFTGQSQYVVKVRARIDALKKTMNGKLAGEPGEERQIKVVLRRLLTQLGVNLDVPGVIHGDNQVSKYRYDAILTATEAADNPVLADGDSVLVP